MAKIVRFAVLVIVKNSQINATSKQSGVTEGKHCTDCGAVIVEQKKIPKGSHLRGDTNNNDIDGGDVIHLMRYLAGEVNNETGSPVEINQKNADITGNDNVDERHLGRLVQYFGGEIDNMD